MAGRCHSGPIAVCDTFTAVVAGESPCPATLRVESLLFYGRPVPRLDEGDTAELHLTGNAAHVAPGVLLIGDVP
ncbi:hypothetical protein ALI22I_13470 [Saccharothrix sp. ALI-22-I]|uniref:hypothetical protein n=1 Tax=Saccharothrix sp. ALI-22-I TaxID=1933778 RepID=UPI00097C6D66|nr:hypothetical protein [Saccharothrix sp. ALI-22-I]ONI89935.1 hypothetical protein ALI22I_13470 [Saccharothrix sp. ALI-22-I]